ncbi:CBS domain-containing protein [Actinomadura oligospora]|uniref:CBS domain-containing protein n=1 Tax=Actinomadura oligospora TaxID=111804 RepID=UPI00047DB8A7|nr:CBS domain-containing protein [Actinomadura oligospora]
MSDVMTVWPRSLPRDATLHEAARLMRDEDIGDVLVTVGGRLCGMVTDRDIVVRALAEDLDARITSLGEVCTADLVTVRPDDRTSTAVRLMRERAVRRLPVVDAARRPVGIVSLGDLVGRDGLSAPALEEIWRAPPNV